jgi:hypothetical protein
MTDASSDPSPGTSPGFKPEETAELTLIWDRLYDLYLERAIGDRPAAEIEAEIAELIRQRDAIRPWGWNTGRNWKDDIPPEELAKMFRK